MTRVVSSILLAGLASLAIAAPHRSRPPKTQGDRVTAIWDAAAARLSRQGDIWFDTGDFPRAIQLLKFQLAIDPIDYENVTNLGWMLENINEFPAALKIYEDFRRASPDDPDSSFPEAYYYFAKRQYAKVIPLIESRLSKIPQANAFRILARSYENLKRYSDAIRVLKLQIANHPEDGAAKANLKRVEKKAAGKSNASKA